GAAQPRRFRREASRRRRRRELARRRPADRAARVRDARADRRSARRRRRLSMEHSKRIEIRWRDLDVYGHVNHVVYLTYLQEARDEWLGRVLGDPKDVCNYVVARVEIDYRR